MRADHGEILAQLHLTADLGESIEASLGAVRTLIPCDYVGVLVVDAGEIVTSAATDPIVTRANELQAVHREGPGWSAIGPDHSFRTGDASHEPRWRNWCQAIAALGLKSVLFVGMWTTRPGSHGALTLYSTRLDAFDDRDRAMAHVLGHHAALALNWIQPQLASTSAVRARVDVGRAQGVLMARYGLTPEQALNVVRLYATLHGFKLRDVARVVALTNQLPPALAHDVGPDPLT